MNFTTEIWGGKPPFQKFDRRYNDRPGTVTGKTQADYQNQAGSILICNVLFPESSCSMEFFNEIEYQTSQKIYVIVT